MGDVGVALTQVTLLLLPILHVDLSTAFLGLL